MLSYISFISATERVGKSLDGRGAPAIKLPAAAGDPQHGQLVFTQTCVVCHGANGQGQRLAQADAQQTGRRYLFPPLWGPDSYNDGAGMARAMTAARFVHANMPFGTTYAAPVLSDTDAFDVVAYISGQPRPHMAELEADFPDRSRKPVDATYPPYIGPFPAEQHRVGPFPPMEAWMKANAAA